HHPADFVGTPPKEGNFGAPDGEEVEEARRGAPTFIALDSGEVAEPDLIIVPGLAFSKDGDRLGFGGGWYDRFLARWPNVMKIGIVQKEFLLDRVPVEEHDVRVDRVIVIYAIREDDFK
ncbi:MAG: 5-formyltetrahydrofolate cyclo-ligase, partial [Oscillospiraceae bacterium]|nr:5-formyltetrahydrofolate cyclo-ligase [Oscillospiraceae bacterium]